MERRPHLHVAATKEELGRPSRPPLPSEAEEKLDKVERLERFIRRLVGAGFFGKFTVSMQNGKVTEVRTEQVLKTDELG